jgi:hypothetical protein
MIYFDNVRDSAFRFRISNSTQLLCSIFRGMDTFLEPTRDPVCVQAGYTDKLLVITTRK